MAKPGISTLGVQFAYADAGSTAPSTVTFLTRINAIAGIALSTEQIDASALEDYVSKYVKGRQDTGGTWAITVNMTDDTIAEWDAIKGTTKEFEVIFPDLTEAFWVQASVPENIPMPEVGQNALATVEIQLVIESYDGMAAKVTATA